MKNSKKAILGGTAMAAMGAGYVFGRRRHENRKSTYQKILDKIDNALD